MKRSKAVRVLVTLLMLAMIFSLTACGGSSDSSSNSSSSDSAAEPAADEGETFELRLVHSFNENTVHGLNAIKFKELVEEKTNGRIKVTIHPNAEMGTSANEINLVLGGVVDAQYANSYTIEAFEPAEAIYSLPFLFDLSDMSNGEALLKTTMENEKVDEILHELYAEKGIYRLGNFPTLLGSVLVANNKRPVEKLEDYAGLKVRHPGGMFAELYVSSMGGSPTMVTASEVPVGLQQGVFDGLLANIAHIHDSRWDTNYLTLPYWGTCSCPILINMDWWNKLPADLQDIMNNEVVPELKEYIYELVPQREFDALEEMQQDPYNVQVTILDKAEYDRIIEETGVREAAINKYLDEAGPKAQELVDAVLGE
ncbi:MAG: TRAP transporter substrate-binding protein [Firmicutes bacterium]|nr:TRAP transporter substrate-binding protein [Bacillota bacterium]